MGKISDLVREARQSGTHYCRVIGPAGKPVAALVALTAPALWAQRFASHIVFWYSEQPGAGWKLLRDYRSWVLSQRNIRVAGYQMDHWPVDHRIHDVFERCGFKRRGGGYLIYPIELRTPLIEQATMNKTLEELAKEAVGRQAGDPAEWVPRVAAASAAMND